MKLLLVVTLLVGTSLAYPVDKEEQPTVPLVITDYSSVAEAQAQIQDKPAPVHNHDSAESNESSESAESSEVKKPEQTKLEAKSIEASSSSEEAKPNVEDKPIAQKLEKPEKEEKELKPVDEPLTVVENNKVIEEIKPVELPVEPAIKNIVPEPLVPEVANVEEPVKVEEPAKLEETNAEPKVKSLQEPLKQVELLAELEKIETPLALPTTKAIEPIVPVLAPVLPIANIPEKPESLPEALPSEKKIDTIVAEEKLPEVKSIEPQVEIKAEEKQEGVIEKRAEPIPAEEARLLPTPEVVEEKKEDKLQENITPAPLQPEIVDEKKKAKSDEPPLVKEEIALIAAEPAVKILEEKLPEPTPQVNPEIKHDEPVAVVVPEQRAIPATDVVATLAELKPEEKELKPEIKELQPEQRIEEPKPVAPEVAPAILPAEHVNDETLVKEEEPKPEILPGAIQSS